MEIGANVSFNIDGILPRVPRPFLILLFSNIYAVLFCASVVRVVIAPWTETEKKRKREMNLSSAGYALTMPRACVTYSRFVGYTLPPPELPPLQNPIYDVHLYIHIYFHPIQHILVQTTHNSQLCVYTYIHLSSHPPFFSLLHSHTTFADTTHTLLCLYVMSRCRGK